MRCVVSRPMTKQVHWPSKIKQLIESGALVQIDTDSEGRPVYRLKDLQAPP